MPSEKYARPDRRPVVIAGASSGIGEATALTLAAGGYPVAVGARRVEKLEALVSTIREAGGEATAHALDVADDASVEEFAAKAIADLGDIEAVVSGAALIAPGRIHEMETATLRRELDVNIVGTQRLAKAFLPGMVERRRGDLVVISSDVAVRARPFMGGYAAGKWGLEGLAAAMQMEMEGTGVRVSVVRPGPTWSEMGMDWDPEETAMVLNGWVKFGHARHQHFLAPQPHADAIKAVIDAPRGVHMNLVEVSPEAPVED
ncbi:SDR family oxidoreductase [Nocardioides acrostichi]|uniref:SDR family oxidoreductase n=1 Tax=Nocardioides acrostichi TaxID=2784339 RepID=A0A930UY38_9ACTN|nr:SDR family oxidoreductase [Nocardioides acrostichi]MBF4162236.1 SDR family oxidoreductase [Nocardioides acrostichi]